MTIFKHHPIKSWYSFIDGILILPCTDIACWCWPWSSCRRPPPWKPRQGCAASPRRRRLCIPTRLDLLWSCWSKDICSQSSRFEILGSLSSVSSALDPYISIWKMSSAKKSCKNWRAYYLTAMLYSTGSPSAHRVSISWLYTKVFGSTQYVTEKNMSH